MTIDTVEQLDEMRARILCRERNCDPETLHQHHEWEDWPTDRKDDRGRLFHYGWRRYVNAARAIRAADDAAGLAVIPVKHDSRKSDMIGEYRISVPMLDEDGDEYMQHFNVPWDVIKQIIGGAIKSSPFKS